MSSTAPAVAPLPDLGAFPAMDVRGRAARLRSVLDQAGCDALLVSKLVNVRYLSGFTGSAAMLLLLPDGMLLVTDGRYAEQAREQIDAAGSEADLAIGMTASAQSEIVASAAAGLRLGVEAHVVTRSQHSALSAGLLPAVRELVDTDGLVESLRLLKDDGEVARIEAAAAIATRALENALPMVGDRPTESEMGLAIDFEIRRLGAEGNSFETIVASGPNGAKPHHRAAGSSKRIEEGDLVVLDYGALVDGYCSDMTRTLCVGPPTPMQQRMLDVVTAAQAAGVAAVRDGTDVKLVDEACRSLIRDAGWGERFSHGTGHGVGLEIHEEPRVTWSVTATLAAGHVVTVEPGVYLPEHGGVRIEDTVVVTADGCRPLTHAPKDPDPTRWPSPPTT